MTIKSITKREDSGECRLVLEGKQRFSIKTSQKMENTFGLKTAEVELYEDTPMTAEEESESKALAVEAKSIMDR